jgi:MFS transporter, SET family, sugar efflux transporter
MAWSAWGFLLETCVQRLLAPSAALLWGLQIAFLIPALALILVTLYDASTVEVGWILTVYNASGFIASLLVPSYADRRRDYLRPMLACGVLTLVLALVLVFTTSLPVAVVALIVVGGPAGVGITMLYAYLRHSGATPADIVNTRAIVSVAWIAGPPLATLIIGAFGNRAILLAIAAIAVLTIATTAVMISQRAAAPDDGDSAKPAEDDQLALRKRAVVLIVAAFVLLQAANATVTSIMTLFVTETVRIDVIWAGIALGVAAGLEVPALILIGKLSLRFSSLPLIATDA